MTYFGVIPLEIVLKILQNLGLNDFVKCRRVSKKFKSIVDNLMKTEAIWEHICRNQLPDQSRAMRRKSSLSWRGICRNICLWRNIARAHRRMRPIPLWPERNHLQTFHVYRDSFIRVGETNVTYHKIVIESMATGFPDFSLIKDLAIQCEDFNETDYMFMMQDEFSVIHLQGKNSKNDTFNANSIQYSSNEMIPFYALQDDYCVLINQKGIVTECKWMKDHFQISFLAKWYGPISGISDLLILDGEIVIVLIKNQVLKVDRKMKQLYIVEAVQAPHSAEGLGDKESRFYVTMAEKRTPTDDPESLITPISRSERPIRKMRSVTESDIKLEIEHVIPNVKYLNTTRISQVCFQHGEMLIVGFNDMVSFYALEKLKSGIFEPQQKFGFIAEEDMGYYSLGNLIKIDVYETKDCHSLIVQNDRRNLFTVTYEYPSHIIQGFPSKTDDIELEDDIKNLVCSAD